MTDRRRDPQRQSPPRGHALPVPAGRELSGPEDEFDDDANGDPDSVEGDDEWDFGEDNNDDEDAVEDDDEE